MRKERFSNERGQALIEFTISMVLVLVLLSGFGRFRPGCICLHVAA